MQRKDNLPDIINNYNELISKKQNFDVELEIRFTILNFNVFQSIYEKIHDDYKSNIIGKIEESNTLTIDQKDKSIRKRKESYFEKGVKKLEKYILKKQLHRIVINNSIDYRISLSTEQVIPEFPINLLEKNDIRLRLRSSLYINELPNWRIDFTFIKILKDIQQIQNIIKYRDVLFPKDKVIKSTDFISHIENILDKKAFGIDNDPQISYELELEYIGKSNISEDDINNAVNLIKKYYVTRIGEYTEYQEKLYYIAKLILSDQDKIAIDNKSGYNISNQFKSKYTLKQLANQPVGFNYEEYITKIIPNIDQYYLSDKADGERCFILINNGTLSVLSSSHNIDIPISSINKFDENYFDNKKNTILDAEVMGLDYNNKKFDKIFAFDILYLNDEKLTNVSMDERNNKLNIICSKTGPTIQKKIMVRLSNSDDPDSNYKYQINDIYSRASRLYPIDGLIFTPNNTNSDSVKYNQPENYFDMIVYKWKPPEQMTIDFLVMKIPKNLIGIKPYLSKTGFDIYLLFCGIKFQTFKLLNLEYMPEYKNIFEGYKFADNYFPIQFTPSINHNAYIYYHPKNFKLNNKLITEDDLHGHVVEFKYDCASVLDQDLKQTIEKNKCLWIIERLRTDRDINVEKGIGFGNDFKTAESVYNSYMNPFTLEMLINENKTGGDAYFMTQKLPIYKALTKYNGFVKAQILRQLENSDWIIDLASGKGQDLFVYNGFYIKNGLFMDIDKDALVELNKRKYDFDKQDFYVYNKKPNTNMSVFSKNMDLTKDYNEIINNLLDIKLPEKGVDGIVINFALHYIIINQTSLDNFINLVNKLLKPGGIFIFTCFDGNKIQDLLKNINENESWDLYENDTLKYSIKKLYNNSDENEFGKKISVIHPFSAGNYYEENLLNLTKIVDTFKENNFVLRQFGSFGDLLQKYKSFNMKRFNELTKNDIMYSSLYSYCSLWKSI